MSSQRPRRALPQHLPPRPKSSLVHCQARAPPPPRWYCPPRWAPPSRSSRTRTSSSRLPPGLNRVKVHKVCCSVVIAFYIVLIFLVKMKRLIRTNYNTHVHKQLCSIHAKFSFIYIALIHIKRCLMTLNI